MGELTNLAPFKLYVIIDLAGQNRHPPDRLAKEALHGGVDLIQLRYKGDDLRQLWQWGERILPLTQKAGVPLIINDRADLALALGATGVHLGQGDLPFSAARRVLGQRRVIGISCHNLEQALIAQAEGADYVSLGPIFPSMSKLDAKPPLGPSLIAHFNRRISIPWVAIGGINLDNLVSLIKAGAKRVAVISAISQAEDVAQTTQQLKKRLL